MSKKLDLFFNNKLLERGHGKFEVLNYCLTEISYKRRKFYLENDSNNCYITSLVFSTKYSQHRSKTDIKQALLKNWDTFAIIPL